MVTKTGHTSHSIEINVLRCFNGYTVASAVFLSSWCKIVYSNHAHTHVCISFSSKAYIPFHFHIPKIFSGRTLFEPHTQKICLPFLCMKKGMRNKYRWMKEKSLNIRWKQYLGDHCIPERTSMPMECDIHSTILHKAKKNRLHLNDTHRSNQFSSTVWIVNIGGIKT